MAAAGRLHRRQCGHTPKRDHQQFLSLPTITAHPRRIPLWQARAGGHWPKARTLQIRRRLAESTLGQRLRPTRSPRRRSRIRVSSGR